MWIHDRYFGHEEPEVGESGSSQSVDGQGGFDKKIAVGMPSQSNSEQTHPTYQAISSQWQEHIEIERERICGQHSPTAITRTSGRRGFWKRIAHVVAFT